MSNTQVSTLVSFTVADSSVSAVPSSEPLYFGEVSTSNTRVTV